LIEGTAELRYFVTIAGASVEVELGPSRDGRTSARIVRGADQSTEHLLELQPIEGLSRVALELDGSCHDVLFEEDARGVHVTIDGERHAVVIEDERQRAAHLAAGSVPRGPVTVRAAMPGILRAVLVKAGEGVVAGQPLVILEAMKMENEVRAEHAGVVREVKVAAGTPVECGAALLVIDPPVA
jgi:biotin carboxyl carrier protein